LVAFSKSAAHKAAPTVFVNENKIEANGTISNTNDAIPSLKYWSVYPGTNPRRENSRKE
jgi:hypothetical protein